MTLHHSDQPYWSAAAEGRLVYQACVECGTGTPYPKESCPRCGHRQMVWQTAKGTGTIYSFSVVHRAPVSDPHGQLPYVLALVDLPEGIRRLSWIVDCPPERVRVGMPVHAVFRKVGDRTAPFFTPVETA